jgi:hypothetical protein
VHPAAAESPASSPVFPLAMMAAFFGILSLGARLFLR